MRERPFVLVLAGLVGATTVACGDATATGTATATRGSSAPAAADDPWSPGPAPAVQRGPRTIQHGAQSSTYTLQDLGAAADRRVLRYRPRAGTRNDFEIAFEDMAASSWHPRVTLHGTSEIVAIDDHGWIHARDRVDRITVDRGRSDGAGVADLQALYDRLVGLTDEAVFDARGIRLQETVTVPHGDVDDDVVGHVTWYLGTPGWLPEPAVGIGARWIKTQAITHPGRVTARTASWELVAVRGEAIEVRGTSSDSGRQAGGVSSTATGEFADVVDLVTLQDSGTSSLHGEYRVPSWGEPRILPGGCEAHVVFRPSAPGAERATAAP